MPALLIVNSHLEQMCQMQQLQRKARAFSPTRILSTGATTSSATPTARKERQELQRSLDLSRNRLTSLRSKNSKRSTSFLRRRDAGTSKTLANDDQSQAANENLSFAAEDADMHLDWVETYLQDVRKFSQHLCDWYPQLEQDFAKGLNTMQHRGITKLAPKDASGGKERTVAFKTHLVLANPYLDRPGEDVDPWDLLVAEDAVGATVEDRLNRVLFEWYGSDAKEKRRKAAEAEATTDYKAWQEWKVTSTPSPSKGSPASGTSTATSSFTQRRTEQAEPAREAEEHAAAASASKDNRWVEVKKVLLSPPGSSSATTTFTKDKEKQRCLLQMARFLRREGQNFVYVVEDEEGRRTGASLLSTDENNDKTPDVDHQAAARNYTFHGLLAANSGGRGHSVSHTQDSKWAPTPYGRESILSANKNSEGAAGLGFYTDALTRDHSLTQLNWPLWSNVGHHKPLVPTPAKPPSKTSFLTLAHQQEQDYQQDRSANNVGETSEADELEGFVKARTNYANFIHSTDGENVDLDRRENAMAKYNHPGWFLGGMTSPKRKNIVIVLDRSKSMRQFDAWAQACLAATGLLEALQPTDRFAVVAYTDSLQLSSFELLPATAANVLHARLWLRHLGTPMGGTDLFYVLAPAMALAFFGVLPEPWRHVFDQIADLEVAGGFPGTAFKKPPAPLAGDCLQAADFCESTVVLLTDAPPLRYMRSRLWTTKSAEIRKRPGMVQENMAEKLALLEKWFPPELDVLKLFVFVLRPLAGTSSSSSGSISPHASGASTAIASSAGQEDYTPRKTSASRAELAKAVEEVRAYDETLAKRWNGKAYFVRTSALEETGWTFTRFFIDVLGGKRGALDEDGENYTESAPSSVYWSSPEIPDPKIAKRSSNNRGLTGPLACIQVDLAGEHSGNLVDMKEAAVDAQRRTSSATTTSASTSSAAPDLSQYQLGVGPARGLFCANLAFVLGYPSWTHMKCSFVDATTGRSLYEDAVARKIQNRTATASESDRCTAEAAEARCKSSRTDFKHEWAAGAGEAYYPAVDPYPLLDTSIDPMAYGPALGRIPPGLPFIPPAIRKQMKRNETRSEEEGVHLEEMLQEADELLPGCLKFDEAERAVAQQVFATSAGSAKNLEDDSTELSAPGGRGGGKGKLSRLGQHILDENREAEREQKQLQLLSSSYLLLLITVCIVVLVLVGVLVACFCCQQAEDRRAVLPAGARRPKVVVIVKSPVLIAGDKAMPAGRTAARASAAERQQEGILHHTGADHDHVLGTTEQSLDLLRTGPAESAVRTSGASLKSIKSVNKSRTNASLVSGGSAGAARSGPTLHAETVGPVLPPCTFETAEMALLSLGLSANYAKALASAVARVDVGDGLTTQELPLSDGPSIDRSAAAPLRFSLTRGFVGANKSKSTGGPVEGHTDDDDSQLQAEPTTADLQILEQLRTYGDVDSVEKLQLLFEQKFKEKFGHDENGNWKLDIEPAHDNLPGKEVLFTADDYESALREAGFSPAVAKKLALSDVLQETSTLDAGEEHVVEQQKADQQDKDKAVAISSTDQEQAKVLDLSDTAMTETDLTLLQKFGVLTVDDPTFGEAEHVRDLQTHATLAEWTKRRVAEKKYVTSGDVHRLNTQLLDLSTTCADLELGQSERFFVLQGLTPVFAKKVAKAVLHEEPRQVSEVLAEAGDEDREKMDRIFLQNKETRLGMDAGADDKEFEAAALGFMAGGGDEADSRRRSSTSGSAVVVPMPSIKNAAAAGGDHQPRMSAAGATTPAESVSSKPVVSHNQLKNLLKTEVKTFAKKRTREQQVARLKGLVQEERQRESQEPSFLQQCFCCCFLQRQQMNQNVVKVPKMMMTPRPPTGTSPRPTHESVGTVTPLHVVLDEKDNRAEASGGGSLAGDSSPRGTGPGEKVKPTKKPKSKTSLPKKIKKTTGGPEEVVEDATTEELTGGVVAAEAGSPVEQEREQVDSSDRKTKGKKKKKVAAATPATASTTQKAISMQPGDEGQESTAVVSRPIDELSESNMPSMVGSSLFQPPNSSMTSLTSAQGNSMVPISDLTSNGFQQYNYSGMIGDAKEDRRKKIREQAAQKMKKRDADGAK
ncbi:unnamed protein product [Amoebophrya sp. A120]|nr:unnamed protein product [Amoebophrya sp. A120]|eukprot:GSA120T00021379001.1